MVATMKYNANGGQRRSSTGKLDIRRPTVQCRLCKVVESRLSANLKDWEMQHMHFEDGELQFLTCSKCKKLNPMVMLERLAEKEPV